MSDLSEGVGQIARSAGIIFGGTVLGQGLALLAETLIARSLPPDTYGSLSLAYTVVLLVSTVSLFGIHNGVTRFMTAFEDSSDKRLVFYHGNLLIVGIGIVSAICLIVGRDLLSQVLNEPAFPELLVLFLPLLVLEPVRQVSYGALRTENRPTAAVVSKDLSGRTLPLIVLLVAVFLSHQAFGAVAYWIGYPLVTFAVSTYFLRDIYEYDQFVEGVPNRRIVRRLWSFSWPLAFSAFIFIFLSYLDIIMIGFFMQSEFVGYYRSIQPMREATTFALGAFSFLYMPLATEYFEEGELSHLGKLYTVTTKWAMMGTFPIVLVLGLFSEDVVYTVLGSEYVPAAPVLTILIFGLFFRVVVGLNGSTVKAIDRSRIELVTAATGLLANLVLNVLLIPRYGIVGAAVATVAGYVVYNSLEVMAIYRAVGIHPFSSNNLKPLVPPLLLGLVLRVFYSGGRTGLGTLFVVGIVLVLLQLASVFLTRSFTQEDRYLLERVERTTGVEIPWLR